MDSKTVLADLCKSVLLDADDFLLCLSQILIAEVEELKAKISMSNYSPLDDDGGDETANSNLFPGTNPNSSVTDSLVLDSGAIKRGAEVSR